MINKKMYELGAAPNKIRELFMYGLGRKAIVGEENVYDFSIGNPSVPAPEAVKKSFLEQLDGDPVKTHEYTPSPGDFAVRQKVAEHITKRFGKEAKPENIYMTSGGSSAIAISLAAVTNPGDEVIVISPYFPEYLTWAGNADCDLVVVPALEPSFQLDVPAIEAAITERTSVVIINSPNNPTGAVYPREALEALTDMMKRKSAELGRRIFLLSDEPYRELVYGAEVPYIPAMYDDTLLCYTWSKSLSLPGERIGYVHVNDTMEDAANVYLAISGAGRSLGYICASVMLQRAVSQCIDEPADVEEYAKNRKLLTGILSEIGYEYVEPEGAFYLWMRALEPDAVAFSDRAKDYELLLVPSDSFGTTGWIRLTYCISEDTIRNSKPALKALYDSYK